jgi:hypothetical protein
MLVPSAVCTTKPGPFVSTVATAEFVRISTLKTFGVPLEVGDHLVAGRVVVWVAAERTADCRVRSSC